MVWYDADRIERTVTRQFVCSQLLPDEIARLDRPLAFGDGLTDGTYWEWIDQKAKRIFLILVDLHVPDQIFGVIDDSWDDEDLPIALDHVERLELRPTRDERFDRKFYQRQFYYLLKPLVRSDTIVVYDDMDVVPLDIVDSSSGEAGSPGGLASGAGAVVGGGSSSSGAGDRVILPNYSGMVFSRRRVPLTHINGSAYGPGYATLEEFQYEVNSIKSIQNDHLVSYFTSYVHQGYGYVLFTPASDGNLKSFLANTPASIKAMSKRDRRRLIFNWIHCLVDTLCFIHNRGLSHGKIKPSNVLFSYRNQDNHIFFSDFTHFGMDVGSGSSHDRASFDKESYDYAAPEQWYRPSGSTSGGSSRKGTLIGEGGAGGRGAGMVMYAGSVYGGASGSTSSNGGSGGNTGLGLSISPENASSTGYAFQMGTSGKFSISRSNTIGSISGDGHYSMSGHSMLIPQLNPQAADVFSLGCIILELLSFMLKRPARSFATHRAAKHKTPGRGGAVLDSSFHKNLGQVESWMAMLSKDAASSLNKSKKKRGKDDSEYDTTLAGVVPMLYVVERMLSLHASERPSAYDVQTRMYQILRDHCDILEPHCVHEYGGFNMGWMDYSGYGAPTSCSGAASATSTSYGGSYSIGGGPAASHYTSSGAVSPTGMVSPTATGIGSYSWGSNSGVASPTAGLSRTNSFNHQGSGQRAYSVRRTASSTHNTAASSSHSRTDSGDSSSAGSSTGGGVGGASVILEEEPEGSGTSEKDGPAKGTGKVPQKGGIELTDGLQAIRNLQIRDKVRQSWNPPAYAAY